MKNILLTGATGVLGVAITNEFKDSNVILTDLDVDRLKKLQLKYKAENPDNNYHIFPADLSSEIDLANLITFVKDTLDVVDLLINNAAVTGTDTRDGYVTKFENQSLIAFKKALDVNLVAPFYICQQLYSNLFKSTKPKIINIASVYGLQTSRPTLYKDTAMESPAAYEASKAGLIHLTKYLAARFAPKILVNAVAPGGIFRNQDSLFISRYRENVPLNRMAELGEIINAINWLSSDTTDYITGQIIQIDGGLGIW
jgi:NAD(P)-dependent dehydrogenase (short-subunit alcohol dehydrogenase family)